MTGRHGLTAIRAGQPGNRAGAAQRLAAAAEGVWTLYLHGGALAFEEGRMGVHQIVAIRRAG